MRRADFKHYLMNAYERKGGGHLPEASAVSYCDYVAGVEVLLGINLDNSGLSGAGLSSLIRTYESAASRAGTPDGTVSNAKTGLRAYTRFRNATR